MIADQDVSLEGALKQEQEFEGAFNVGSNAGVALQSCTPQPLYESDVLMIADFNRFFIQVLIVNVPSVIWEHDNDYTIFSYENFHKQFSYVQIIDLFGGNSSIKATRRWLDSPRKRSCREIKFWPSTEAVDPEDPDNKLFNTWRDWATKPIEDRRMNNR